MTQDVKEIERRLATSQEVWELTVDGRVHVPTTNHLGRVKDVTAAGKGGRLRLSTLDRELAEENIRRPEYNPFRNGALIQVGGDKLEGDERREALSDAELAEYFLLASEDDFVEALEDIGEVNMRRLQSLAKVKNSGVSLAQSNAIDTIIEERYRIGGDTPTYREMMADPSR